MHIDTDAIRQAYSLPDIALRVLKGTHCEPRSATGHEFRGNCPFHGGSSGTSFAIWWANSHWRYTCFAGCGSGDVIDFVRMLYGLDFPEAIAFLTDQPQECRSPHIQPQRLKPNNKPMKPTAAQYFHGLIDRQIDEITTPRVWWHNRGVNDQVIARYLLGYCPQCPTAMSRQQPNLRFASMTIPVPTVLKKHDSEPKQNNQSALHLHTIRHRLVPYGPGGPGDKYRPHRKGDGVALFGGHELPEHSGKPALIVEGEVKKLVLESFGLDQHFVILSATGGMAAWSRSESQESWMPLLDDTPEVYILLDPDPQAREHARNLARLFGRRARLAFAPNKVDDYLLVNPRERLNDLSQILANAQRVTRRMF